MQALRGNNSEARDEGTLALDLVLVALQQQALVTDEAQDEVQAHEALEEEVDEVVEAEADEQVQVTLEQ